MSSSSLPIPGFSNPELSPEYLFAQPHYIRPVLYMDRRVITSRYEELAKAIPGADVHYAMKCNPDKLVLEHVKNLGGKFEIASYAELDKLQKIGVNPADVLYSNPVKSLNDIRSAYKAGVRCFAFQSEDELTKFEATQHDGDKINVYLRLATSAGKSTVASESKFGQSIMNDDGKLQALKLMKLARSFNLVPYGLAFHVGSQMEDPKAWTNPLKNVGLLMKILQQNDIHLSMLDIGGGFPAYHAVGLPPLSEFGKVIMRELAELPYRPDRLVLEPGRALVSDAGVIVTEVYGKAFRDNRWWIYLSIGAFNGLMESLETRTELQFPMADSCHSKQQYQYIVSGPSCDGQDTITSSQSLSADIAFGDKIAIYTTGAYTTAYASRFNGFETPLIKYVA